MEPETTLYLGIPLRSQARHCHWGSLPTTLPTPGLTPDYSLLFPPILLLPPDKFSLFSMPQCPRV